jgi:hypothetical protein
MKPLLVDVCRYISFEGLHEALAAAHDYVSFLNPPGSRPSAITP